MNIKRHHRALLWIDKQVHNALDIIGVKMYRGADFNELKGRIEA